MTKNELENTIAVLWNQYKQAKSQREYESIVNRINYLSGKLDCYSVINEIEIKIIDHEKTK